MIQIGHRGAAGWGPENTASAFYKALSMGVEGIELDVHLTKDREVVVHHDYTTGRQTGVDYPLRQLTLEELKALDFANYKHDHPQVERILTLEELFGIIPDHILLNIEIKNTSSLKTDIAPKVVEKVQQHQRSSSVLISSFDHQILKEVSTLDRNLKLGLLLYANHLNPLDYIQSLGFPIYSIHLAVELVDKNTICTLQGEGYRVYIYTVNTQEDYDTMKEAGACGVITDFPGRFSALGS